MSKVPAILVVDDEPLIAMLVADWLNELGCQVIGPANRASDALSHIEGASLNAVLLDVSLGSEDSFALADLARAKSIPVAFVTGRAATDLPPRFKGAPILPKPFEFEDIKRLIADLLPPAEPALQSG
jgi:DNA-binding response OmpR family regulator